MKYQDHIIDEMEHPEEVEKIPLWYDLSETELYEKLQTNIHGLEQEEVELRQKEFGLNRLPSKKAPGLITIFIHQFLSPLIYILLAAAIVALIIGETTDAVFIFAVILLNASLGCFQEWKAEKSAAALQNLLVIETKVKREGLTSTISAEDLVPGDLVYLESGNRVPADLRLIKSNQTTIDESLLTGESITVEKDTALLSGEVPLAERKNMTFAGSTVITGRATGLVVATGINTEVGQIAGVVLGSESTKPPLLLRMEKFSKQISIIVLGFIILLALFSVAQGKTFAEVFFLSVALAVSSIPEGLPVAMTVALSIATSRMAKRNVIVRKLTAVEGLGSCTCIASDKTGTLTVNKQTVRTISLPGKKNFQVSGEGYNGNGEVTTENQEELTENQTLILQRLARAAALCNEAHLTKKDDKWKYTGDSVDIALLAYAYKMGLDPNELHNDIEIAQEIPFESERRYSAIFYRPADQAVSENQTNMITDIAVKGAVEALLPYCQTMQTEGGVVPIDRDSIEEEATELAEQGYRVISVAYKTSENLFEMPVKAHEFPALTFLGFIGLIDPLRPEVKMSIEKCNRAGVRVVMVTGDHPATALSIAKDLGIASGDEDMITGTELSEIGTPDVPQFIETVRTTTVFSRVAPLQKLHIVEALKKLGHFVAVTGDGVNDAPALKKANIGVAMGSGTDVAKDTASIIITDDNFTSIEGGVEEGRFAYDNIRKVIYLLISTGASEIVLFTLALFSGHPVPLMAAQLLWLNLVTNGIQDVALAFEGGEPGVMSRTPRKPSEGVFNRLMIEQSIVSGMTIGLLAFASWFWLLDNGWSEFSARNMVLLLMVLFENVHVFNCRSETISAFKVPFKRNLLLIWGVVIAQGVHIMVMYIPLMQRVLDIEPVSFFEWLTLISIALILLLVMEIFKFMKQSFRMG